MDRNKLLKCWTCGKSTSDQSDEDNFWWCNTTCKKNYYKKEVELHKKLAEKHTPQSRRGEIDRTNELLKEAVKNPVSNLPFYGKRKGNRKCGKCGKSGHNSRTCKS